MKLDIHERDIGAELCQRCAACCRIYGTNDFPDLCAQFNCVSWAKANDTYSERNTLLVRAQQALNRLQKRVEG